MLNIWKAQCRAVGGSGGHRFAGAVVTAFPLEPEAGLESLHPLPGYRPFTQGQSSRASASSSVK